MTEARERRIVVVLGANGMGKTGAVTVPIIQAYVDVNGTDAVLGLDPSSSLKSYLPELAPRFEWPGAKGVEPWIVEVTADGAGPAGGGWGPGLLVMDDADRFLTPSSLDSFREVWVANRHLGLDVLVNGHRPQGLPKELFMAVTELWVFALREPHAMKYLSCIDCLEPIIRLNMRKARSKAEKKEVAAWEAEHGHSFPRLPKRKGEALRVRQFSGEVELLELFAA